MRSAFDALGGWAARTRLDPAGGGALLDEAGADDASPDGPERDRYRAVFK